RHADRGVDGSSGMVSDQRADPAEVSPHDPRDDLEQVFDTALLEYLLFHRGDVSPLGGGDYFGRADRDALDSANRRGSDPFRYHRDHQPRRRPADPAGSHGALYHRRDRAPARLGGF